jgi:hypothetical protein
MKRDNPFNIKPGDKVICVNPNEGLSKCKIYTVREVFNISTDTLFKLEETTTSHWAIRFILATELSRILYENSLSN